jgi:endonuclease G
MIRALLCAATLALAPAVAFAQAKPAAPPPTATPQCLAKFSPVGLPVHRGDDVATRQVLVCRDGYALSFNNDTRNPDWVIERLTPAALTGAAKRADNFRHDPLVPASPTPQDYSDPANPRDRGHQAPAADFKFSQPQTDDSFYMSNMSPQIGPGFNRAQWRFLEEDVRAAVLCGGHQDVIVVTGPIYGGSALWIGKGATKILSPAAYFKVLYDVQSGRAIGFRLDNKAYKKTPSDQFIVPISQLEVETGLDFLAALPRRDQNILESSKGSFWGHGQGCANSVKE